MKTVILPLLTATLIGWASVASAQTTNRPASPPIETKECFQCQGTGTAKCPQTNCRDGQRNCPAPCLKLSVGVWEKRTVPGHTDPNERWQKVFFGKKSAYWSSGHLGEVPTLNKDGTFTSPRCPTCNGTTLVACAKCQGRAVVTCDVCAGTKVVPPTWSAFDHPYLKNRPDRIHLTDGQVLIGRKIAEADGKTSIRMEKKIIHLDSATVSRIEPQPTVAR